MIYMVSGFLVLSIVLNVYLFMHFQKLARQKPMSIEASDLLANILNGSAVVRIIPIDPANILLRSPRG